MTKSNNEWKQNLNNQKIEIQKQLKMSSESEQYVIDQYNYHLTTNSKLTEFQKNNIKIDIKISRQRKRFYIYAHNFNLPKMIQASKECDKRELNRLEDYEELTKQNEYKITAVCLEGSLEEEGVPEIDTTDIGEAGYLTYSKNIKETHDGRKKLIQNITEFLAFSKHINR